MIKRATDNDGHQWPTDTSAIGGTVSLARLVSTILYYFVTTRTQITSLTGVDETNSKAFGSKGLLDCFCGLIARPRCDAQFSPFHTALRFSRVIESRWSASWLTYSTNNAAI